MLRRLTYYVLVAIISKGLQVVVSADQCTKYRFKSPFFPGVSCEDIYNKNPESRGISGYYWITDGPRKVYCGMNYIKSTCEEIYNNYPDTVNKSGYYRIDGDQWVYCNMTTISGYIPTCAGIGGGWTRIGHFNISAGDECPSGWMKDTESGVSFCRPPGTNPVGYTCYSTYFSTNEKNYSSVCGRARGYQKGRIWGFYGSTRTAGNSIEGSYVDGLSITHGTGPRHHIWTYAVGYNENNYYGCPCNTIPSSSIPPPSYVNDNYYCESGTTTTPAHATYYFSDPLWDGSGCSTSNGCCSDEQLPWFYRNLGHSTTDDIEARICISIDSYTYGAVVIDQLELYIQ